jgi:glyoxylase-like metal-dependent hydrolase (beta-lactamase superfamily II)
MPPFGPPAWEVSNVYFVGNGELFMIDAGYATPESINSILGAWRELGAPSIKAILITHAHLDHAGGLVALERETKAPVWAHKVEADFFGEMFPQERIERTLEDGDKIEVDGIKLKALHFPGHTSGHMGFLDESTGSLFTGDMVLGSGYAVIVPPRGDMVEYMTSLRKAAQLPLKKILPGHGRTVENPKEKIEEYITHRILREIQILRHLENGPKAIPEMAEDIYFDMHPVLRYAGRMQALAHLVKMEAEGLVEPVSGAGLDAMYSSLVGKLPF